MAEMNEDWFKDGKLSVGSRIWGRVAGAASSVSGGLGKHLNQYREYKDEEKKAGAVAKESGQLEKPFLQRFKDKGHIYEEFVTNKWFAIQDFGKNFSNWTASVMNDLQRACPLVASALSALRTLAGNWFTGFTAKPKEVGQQIGQVGETVAEAIRSSFREGPSGGFEGVAAQHAGTLGMTI